VQIFPFTQKEVNLLRKLNKHKIPYLIVGLSAAALQGSPVVTKDVDIWFKDLNSKKLKDIFKECRITYIPSINLNPPMLAGKGVELIDIVTQVHGISDFDTEFKKALKIKLAGVLLNVLPLEKIIKSKEYLNRTKDKYTLPVLRDTLTVNKTKSNI
jgi:hypothetical protein